MSQQVESLPMSIQHGHTEDKVLIKFTRMVDHVLMTPDEARAMARCVLESLENLEAYRKNKVN